MKGKKHSNKYFDDTGFRCHRSNPTTDTQQTRTTLTITHRHFGGKSFCFYVSNLNILIARFQNYLMHYLSDENEVMEISFD